MLSAATAKSPSKQFARLMLDARDGACAQATSFNDLKRLFKTSGASHLLLNTLKSASPVAPLLESSTVLSCCSPDIAELRAIISKFNDIKILVFTLVADELAAISSQAAAATASESAASAGASASSEDAASGKKKQPAAAAAAAVRRQRINAEDENDNEEGNLKSKPSSTVAATLSKQRVNFLINVVGLLFGVVFPAAANEQPVACAALVAEQQAIEGSDAYQNSNAAERRKALLGSVLAIFSDKGQRHFFSRVWAALLGEVLGYQQQHLVSSCPVPDQQNKKQAPLLLKSTAAQLRQQEQDDLRNQLHILALHLLADVNNSIIPWLTNPLLLSDALTKCYSGGGLLAVLSLEGLLTLILHHGLEYPKFYVGLYALVTPDIFSSPHRNRFFRLLHLAMTSVRVPASVAASFLKRLSRCALICPSPALYFVLPFVRQKLQQHSNCFALIHRSLRDIEEAEAEVEKQIKKEEAEASKNNNSLDKKKTSSSSSATPFSALSAATKSASARVERLKRLFEGVDPFDPKQPDPEKTHAIDSTLWEIATLERHMLPSVRNAVAAFASPAEDHQPLQFERSYQRLFAQAMSSTEISSEEGAGAGGGGGGAMVAVRIPRAQAAARAAALNRALDIEDENDADFTGLPKQPAKQAAVNSQVGLPFGLF